MQKCKNAWIVQRLGEDVSQPIVAREWAGAKTLVQWVTGYGH